MHVETKRKTCNESIPVVDVCLFSLQIQQMTRDIMFHSFSVFQHIFIV